MFRTTLLLMMVMTVVASEAQAGWRPIIDFTHGGDIVGWRKTLIKQCHVPKPTAANNFNKGGCCAGKKWHAVCPDAN